MIRWRILWALLAASLALLPAEATAQTTGAIYCFNSNFTTAPTLTSATTQVTSCQLETTSNHQHALVLVMGEVFGTDNSSSGSTLITAQAGATGGSINKSMILPQSIAIDPEGTLPFPSQGSAIVNALFDVQGGQQYTFWVGGTCAPEACTALEAASSIIAVQVGGY